MEQQKAQSTSSKANNDNLVIFSYQNKYTLKFTHSIMPSIIKHFHYYYILSLFYLGII